MYHLDGWSQDHFFINRFFFLISISVHFRLALGCVHVFIFFSAGLARVINSPHGIWSGHHAVTWSVIRLWTDDLIAVGSSNARFDLRTPPRPTLGNDCKSVYLCWIGFFISPITWNKDVKRHDPIDEQKVDRFIPILKCSFFLSWWAGCTYHYQGNCWMAWKH